MGNGKFAVAIELNEASKQIDPYCCSIQTISSERVVTVGHIPRKISWHCYFFLRKEVGEITGNVFSATYRSSPISSSSLEIRLVLRF